MTTQDLLDFLIGVLEDEAVPGLMRVERYADIDEFTKVDGLVLRFADESEFQLPLIQTRHAFNPSVERAS